MERGRKRLIEREREGGREERTGKRRKERNGWR